MDNVNTAVKNRMQNNIRRLKKLKKDTLPEIEEDSLEGEDEEHMEDREEEKTSLPPTSSEGRGYGFKPVNISARR
jgi:hypothetical protein